MRVILIWVPQSRYFVSSFVIRKFAQGKGVVGRCCVRRCRPVTLNRRGRSVSGATGCRWRGAQNNWKHLVPI